MAIAVDFESFYSTDCNISTLGPWRYLNDPLCDVYLVAVYGEGIEFVGRPLEFDWSLLNGKFLVAHNLAWDGLVFSYLQEQQVIPEEIELSGFACTANLAVYLGAPRNLAGAAKQLLCIDLSKDLRTWMKGKTWEDAVAAGKAEALRDYCLRDARTSHAIWERYGSAWPSHEQSLSVHTMRMGWRGVAIDIARVEDSIRKLDGVMWEAQEKIPWSHSDSAILSPKALGEACRAVGIMPPPSLSEDDPECEEWERRHGDQYPWVGAMRDYRKANALREKLKTMRLRTRPTDGCMGFSLKYFGSHTGRWSGDSGYNLQNLQREESYGVDLRRCIIARPGHSIVACDLSQIEPRVLAWLCGDQPLLDQLAAGIPLYEAHARNTMGWTGGSLKKENPRLYSLAKARVLGLGYGCGPDKFVTVAKTMGGIDISLTEARATVAEFRASNRRIIGLWNRLDADFKRSLRGDFEVELPCGRSLLYRDVSSNGGWTAQTELGGKRQRFYGGKLCENLVQAVARDVFAEALLRLERAGFEVVFHVHDEAVCEVATQNAPEAARAIAALLTTTSDWMPGLPLEAETQISPSYFK